MSSHVIRVRLSVEQQRHLEARAQRAGRPVAAIIGDAVDRYLADADRVDHALDATFGSLPMLELPDRQEWRRG
ncbi:MAG: hypothetical protein U0869_17020 [Chloroflexota bacterium]